MPTRRFRARRRTRRTRFRRGISRRSRRATTRYSRRTNSSAFRPTRRINPANLGRPLSVGGQMTMIHTTKLSQYQFCTNTDTAPTAGTIVTCVLKPDSALHPFGPSTAWQDNQLCLSGSITPSTQFSGELRQTGVQRFADSFDVWEPKWAKINIRLVNKQIFPVVASVNRYIATENQTSDDFGGVQPLPLMAGATAFNLPKTQRYRLGAYNAAKNEREYTKVITVFCPVKSDWKKMESTSSKTLSQGDTNVSAASVVDPVNDYKIYFYVQPANTTDTLTAIQYGTDYRYTLLDVTMEMTQAVIYSDPK